MSTSPEIAEISARCLALVPVGSRVTCNPVPAGADEDHLAFVLSAKKARAGLEAMGFHTTTNESYKGLGSDFVSFKKGLLNIIVTDSAEFYDAFLAATHVAKRLNLLEKSDRVALFQAVLYRAKYDG